MNLPFIATPQQRLARIDEAIDRAASALRRAKASHQRCREIEAKWRRLVAAKVMMDGRYNG